MCHCGSLVDVHEAHLTFLSVVCGVWWSWRRQYLVLRRYFRYNFGFFINVWVLIEIVAIWLFIQFAKTEVITNCRQSRESVINHRRILALSFLLPFSIPETNFDIFDCGLNLLQEIFIGNVAHQVSKHHIKNSFENFFSFWVLHFYIIFLHY